MKDKIYMVPGFPDIETKEQSQAVKKALDLVATGCMHLLEADTVEIIGDIKQVVFMKFANVKDPDFLSNEEVAKIALVTAVGAHSMASGNCGQLNPKAPESSNEEIDLKKLEDTPIDRVFPEITDLLKPKKP